LKNLEIGPSTMAETSLEQKVSFTLLVRKSTPTFMNLQESKANFSITANGIVKL
jgi:hypothetical protein